jgi:outer membrane lipoprotein-sorting protein
MMRLGRTVHTVALAGLLMVGTSMVWAQSADEALAEVLSRVEQTNSSLRDFRARVLQEKHFEDLGETVTFRGTMLYAKPKQMLWEFTDPDASSLLINSDGIWLVVPRIKQIQEIEVDSQERTDTFFLGLEKSLRELSQDYRMEWMGQETLPQGRADRVQLTRPGDSFAAEIGLWFDTVRGIPLRVRWVGDGGEATVTDFFDIQINTGIKPEAFRLNVPEDYERITAAE